MIYCKKKPGSGTSNNLEQSKSDLPCDHRSVENLSRIRTCQWKGRIDPMIDLITVMIFSNK